MTRDGTAKQEEERAMEKRDGQCCEVLGLVLSREPANGIGLVVGSRMDFKTGDLEDALVMKFRKAKRTEEQTNANATFAWCLYCPFCGTPTAMGRRASALRAGEAG